MQFYLELFKFGYMKTLVAIGFFSNHQVLSPSVMKCMSKLKDPWNVSKHLICNFHPDWYSDFGSFCSCTKVRVLKDLIQSGFYGLKNIHFISSYLQEFISHSNIGGICNCRGCDQSDLV